MKIKLKRINCLYCGSLRDLIPCRYKSKFCNKKCYFSYRKKFFVKDNAPSWKGGRRINNGYWWIHNPQFNGRKSNYVAEHRFIMETLLGRKLSRNEEIHHIDGNCLNNDIKNLCIMSPREHARIHIKDIKRRSASKYLGVSYETKSKNWLAKINLGEYKTEQEAINAIENYKKGINL